MCLREWCALRVWWGAVAQLGERLVRNEEVSGSIPLSSTIYSTEEILECPKASIKAGFFASWRPFIAYGVR
jgi:hypothetical protein